MAVLSNTGIRAGASAAGGSGYEIEKSLRIDAWKQNYMTRSVSSTGNTQKFTYSGWIKLAKPGGTHYLLASLSGGLNLLIGVETDYFMFYEAYAGAIYSQQKLRDYSAWYHLVCAVDTTQSTDTNRVKMYINGERVTEFSSAAWPSLDRTTVFNSSGVDMKMGNYSTAYSDFVMSEVHYFDGQQLEASDFGETDSTTGQWVPKKYSGNTASYGTNGFYLKFNGTDVGEDSSGNDNDWTPTGIDTALGTGNYLSGTITGTPYNANYTFKNLFNGAHSGLGAQANGALSASSYKLVFPTAITGTNIYVLGDGTALNASGTGFNFNDITATTSNTTLSGSGSTYKCKLDDVTSLSSITVGAAVNCQGIEVDGVILVDNRFTPDCDVSDDVPTTFEGTGNGNGNYCTWSQNFGQITSSYDNSITHGNLKVTGTGDRHGTMRFGPGKWYWELRYDGGTLGQAYHGVVDIRNTQDRVWPTGDICATRDSGYGFYGDSSTGSSMSAWAEFDIINFAIDADNNKFFMGLNGTWLNSGNPASGTGASFTDRDFANYTPLFSDANTDAAYTANFGARPFAYTPPSGFKALNTYNLSPTIEDPSKHFNTVLYTGDSGTSNAITGVGFEPGLVWIKNRTNANHHSLFDQVRGDTKVIYGSDPAGEDTISDFSFTSDGFTTDSTDAGYNGAYNYTSWNWKSASTDTTKSAGALNSSVYNEDDWIDATTTSNGAIWPGASLSTILNGQDGGSFHGDHNASPSYLLFEWDSGTISGNVRLKLRTYGTAAHSYKVAGDATDHSITVPTLSTFDWYDLGNIDLVEYKGTCPSSGNAAAIEAIELDGKILVDNSQTPTNVPTINTTYRANPEAGFSIVSYTGTGSNGTVAHGLNATPNLILIKNRDSSTSWPVYHSVKGIGSYGVLEEDYTWQTGSASAIYNTEPTSNVFGVGTGSWVNTDDAEYVAYCWSEVAGYSRFADYHGNGENGDGPFVWCGFKPMWILIKRTDSGANWALYDSKINPYNVSTNSFSTSSVGAETAITSDDIDILSNGFKCRANDSVINGSNTATYIFAAFAESPFKHANAR